MNKADVARIREAATRYLLHNEGDPQALFDSLQPIFADADRLVPEETSAESQTALFHKMLMDEHKEWVKRQAHLIRLIKSYKEDIRKLRKLREIVHRAQKNGWKRKSEFGLEESRELTQLEFLLPQLQRILILELNYFNELGFKDKLP